MTRADLVGWTLAELALVLLFAIVAAILPSYQHLLSKNEKLDQALKDSTARSLPQAQQLQELKAHNEALAAALEESKRHLRSTALPSCAEFDSSKGYLFTATVTSSNSFEIDGRSYTEAELLSRFAEPISAAEKAGCFERVKLYFKNDLTASEFQSGRRRIEEHFYPLVLGAQ